MEDQIKVLLERAIAEDEEAFTELYRRYHQSVYIKAYRYLKNDADAKDATQDVFIEVNRSLKNLRNIELFYSWLMMVTSSKCITMMRRRKFDLVEIKDVGHSKHYEEKRVYMDPKKSTHNTNEKETLLSIIDSLPPKQAEVIKLIYFKEMKLSEVAAQLNIPLGTVKTRSSLARKELKRKLDLFEKREHYKLEFHADLLLPTVVLSMAFPSAVGHAIKQVIQQFFGFFSKQAVLATCTVSVAGLVVSGGGLVYRDYQNNEKKKAQVSEVAPLPSNTFEFIQYQEQPIYSYREAYFICLSFAYDEETMKNHTREEYDQILQVYKVMDSQSPYYTTLQNQGWFDLLEKYAL